MELAGRFARTVYGPYWQQFHSKLDLPSPALVVETFRIAGLLHDVGHGPFSHLLDYRYLEPTFGLTHEKMSAHIIRDQLAPIIAGIRQTPDCDRLEDDESIDPEIIASIVETGGERNLFRNPRSYPMEYRGLPLCIASTCIRQ